MRMICDSDSQGICPTSRRPFRNNVGVASIWSFLPSAVRYVGKFGEELLVYYVTDEFSQFKHLDGQKMAAMDREMCERADLVFATAHTLVERKKQFNPETHLASHGVDHAHFASTLAESTSLAPEMAALPPGPVIGFVGLIESWIDLALIEAIAERRPHWQIVLIGKSNVDLSSLKRHDNIHLLGRKPYAELPRYLKAFTVGVIPFVLNELTLNVNPIKLREYLSAGLPVVSSDIPEVRSYADDRDCFVAASHDRGATFAPSVRVNDDTGCATHFHPAMLLDAQDRLWVLWYDNRDGAGHFVYSVSDDGARSFHANRLVSAPVFGFDTFQYSAGWLGDYFRPAITADSIYVLWSDGREDGRSHAFFTAAPLP